MSETNRIIQGDAFEELPELPDESVHAIITDPPYGLNFMPSKTQGWDDFEPKEYQEWCEEWASECKRVLKPGGHLLAFSGNRTHHRLFTGVEDAGYEIRDTLTWHYGSGFPKAADMKKTIEKRDGVGDEWDGWKTGLKPATEYIVMARKPFDGATVDCVLEHETGALNIDETRIPTDESWEGSKMPHLEAKNTYERSDTSGSGHDLNRESSGSHPEGRYPSNVLFDERAADALDSKNEHTVSDPSPRHNSEEAHNDSTKYGDASEGGWTTTGHSDSGGPSRYFYTSKASKSERTNNGSIENDHPTVKPVDLMEWLVKLVTKEGQTILDPFTGSGTTCMAAKNLNREFTGIERQAKYADIARVRCGLTPDDPSVVRGDDDQKGLEQFKGSDTDE